MPLMKFFLSKLASPIETKPDDPLAQPEISAMSQQALADLPLGFAAPKQTRFELPRLGRCA